MNPLRPRDPNPADSNQQLFSYGTLQQAAVQRAVFGHEITGTPDAIVGYQATQIQITDPHVIAASGTDTHTILFPDPDGDDVPGTRFTLDQHQLAAADDYEVDDYTRISVNLRSGLTAWVYVARTRLSGLPD